MLLFRSTTKPPEEVTACGSSADAVRVFCKQPGNAYPLTSAACLASPRARARPCPFPFDAPHKSASACAALALWCLCPAPCEIPCFSDLGVLGVLLRKVRWPSTYQAVDLGPAPKSEDSGMTVVVGPGSTANPCCRTVRRWRFRFLTPSSPRSPRPDKRLREGIDPGGFARQQSTRA